MTLSCNPQITIFGVYAPTEHAENSDKVAFYDRLEKAIEHVARHDLLIVAGDFNARVGHEHRCKNDRNIGPHLYHNETNDNDNGARLVQVCRSFNLVDSPSSRIDQVESGRGLTRAA